MNNHVIWFDQLGMSDVDKVGGKNASLGEMISNLSSTGVNVPNGFATTADAFRLFLEQDDLQSKIAQLLSSIKDGSLSDLSSAGEQIRSLILNTPLPASLEEAIKLSLSKLQGDDNQISVAVRSSATAEDLPDASFAGQQETFLNVVGEDAVLHAVKEVFASLYNDRAISYRAHQGYEHLDVALSVGIQRMVRSESGSAGVMFTLDTESGFDQVVFITSAYGLGETVVQGAVNPDEFYVHKKSLSEGRPAILRRNLGAKAVKMVYSQDDSSTSPVETVRVDREERFKFSINDDDINALAKQALIIEQHYQRPMDIEWAKDGQNGQIYIVQARPETVKSRTSKNVMERYILKETGKVLCEGRSVGHRIGRGPVKVLRNVDQMQDINEGDILVADMTDPDWEPIMKKASAIVTNRGGRTCHAAIIARELGIPAVVGCGDATDELMNGQLIEDM